MWLSSQYRSVLLEFSLHFLDTFAVGYVEGEEGLRCQFQE